jgi:Tol biopolymer transport system component
MKDAELKTKPCAKAAKLCAAAALLLCVCWFRLAAPSAADSPPPYASKTPLAEPTLFGEGVISTGDFESHPAFTPDGRTLYFLKDSPTFNFWTIVFSRHRDGRWTEPEVAPFSGRYSDFDPSLSPDGSKLYFASRRPVAGAAPKADADIWVVERVGNSWGEPKRLGSPVNSDANESSPCVTADGTLYFSSNREGGRGAADLYQSRFVSGAFAAPENLGEAVNTPGPEAQVFVSPDGRVLVFSAAGRADGRGGLDLYVSRRQEGAWTPPLNLGGKINSAGNESAPRLSPDGRYFFWTSTRGYGFAQEQERRLGYRELVGRLRNAGNSLGDIYQIDAAALEAPRPGAAK